MALYISQNVNFKQIKTISIMGKIMRRVTFRVLTNSGLSEEKNGFFHKWGLMTEYSTGDTMYAVSCGIVEDDQCNVYSVHPYNIKFNS